MLNSPSDDASEAMRDAFAAAEVVAGLLDRHWGDAGSDPAVVREWRERLIAIAFEINRELGEPMERLPCGGLVPASYFRSYNLRP